MLPLDRAVNNDVLLVTKALLPYLSPDTQRPIAILVKAMELMFTVNLYSQEDAVRSMTRSHTEGWEKDFLNDVKKNLSKDRAYFIDAILKLTEVKDLLTHTSQMMARDETASLFEEDEAPAPAPPIAPISLANLAGTPNATSPTTGTSPNPDQLIDSLSPLLEPSQVQLLKVLSTFIK